MDVAKYSFSSLQRLEGPRLALSPLRREDLHPLATALISDSTWFSQTRDLNSEAKFVAYFEPKFFQQERGDSLTLVARNKKGGAMVAMSTFQHPGPEFLKVEIGFTWVADKWQRTFVNKEMKYLMLKHAFEVMGTKRVEFSVHPKNEKSNLAMNHLGATLEGTLRKWRFLPGHLPDDGHRNMYSIIDDEWPELCGRLEIKLNLVDECS